MSNNDTSPKTKTLRKLCVTRVCKFELDLYQQHENGPDPNKLTTLELILLSTILKMPSIHTADKNRIKVNNMHAAIVQV